LAPIEIKVTVPDRQRNSGKRAGLVGFHQSGVAGDIGAHQHKAATADHLAVAGGQTFAPMASPVACTPVLSAHLPSAAGGEIVL